MRKNNYAPRREKYFAVLTSLTNRRIDVTNTLLRELSSAKRLAFSSVSQTELEKEINMLVCFVKH